MNASLLAVLNDSERLLIAQTERAELAALDEDAAIEFEARIKRARNKYVGQYRRGASAAVTEHGGRGKARPENTRAVMKAEAFEQAWPTSATGSRSWPGSQRRSFARSDLRRPGPPSKVTRLVRGKRRLRRASRVRR
jgi:hypothetical protein